MNPRRVHELMAAHFPAVDPASQSWTNILESDGALRRDVLAALLDEFIAADELLVEVTRKMGDSLPTQDVIPYLAAHVGHGRIRISDRDFQGYVLVEANGVATGWSAPSS